MERPLEVGDTVMVVRPPPCCGSTKGLGQIYVIKYFYTDVSICSNCHILHVEAIAMRTEQSGVNVSRLVRLPDLTEPVVTTTEEFV